MKGKNILITVALVLGFGGLIASSAVNLVNTNNLKSDIDAVKSGLAADDESNKAAILSSNEAKINQTEERLKELIDAAKEDLEANLRQAKAELEASEAEIVAGYTAADREVAQGAASQLGGIIAELNAISEQMSSAEALLLNAQLEFTAKITEIGNAIAGLQNLLQTVIVPQLSGVVESVVSINASLANFNDVLGSLQTAIKTVKDDLANNYYTKNDINELLSPLNVAIDYLTGLFRDSDGTIVSMATLMSTINAEFASVKADIELLKGSTLGEGSTVIVKLQDDLAAINDRLDKFYGAEAQKTKGGYVNQLSMYYTMFKTNVIDNKYKEIVNFYESYWGVPKKFNDAFAEINYLYFTTLRGLADEGMARIILGADVTEAKEMYEEYKALMDCYMYKIDFMLEKEKVLAYIPTLITNDCPVDFTQEVADYFLAEVEAMDFDANEIAGKSSKEATKYYNDCIHDLYLEQKVAEGYHDLVYLNKDFHDDVNELKAKGDGEHLLEAEGEVRAFKNLSDAKTAFNQYLADVDGVTDDDEVDDFLDDEANYFAVLLTGAQAYDSILLYKAGQMDIIKDETETTSVGKIISDDDKKDAQDLMDEIADFGDFMEVIGDALDALYGEDPETTPFGGTADYATDSKADIVDEAKDIKDKLALVKLATVAWSEILDAENKATSAINAMTYINAEHKDEAQTFIDAFDQDDLYSLLTVYKDTVVDGKYTRKGQFDSYVKNAVKVVNGIKDLASIENDIAGRAYESLALIGDPAFKDYDENGYFTNAVNGAFANYSIISEENDILAMDAKTKLQTMLSLAGAEKVDMFIDCTDIELGLSKFKAAKTTGESLKRMMDNYMASAEKSFKNTYHNSYNDEITAWEEYKDEFEKAYLDNMYYYNDAADSNPTFEYPDDLAPNFKPVPTWDFEDYDASIEELRQYCGVGTDEMGVAYSTTYAGTCLKTSAEVLARYDAYVADVTDVINDMIDKYNSLEDDRVEALLKQYLGENKDGTDGDLYDAVAKEIDAIDNEEGIYDSLITNLWKIYNEVYVADMLKAKTSDEIKALAATCIDEIKDNIARGTI